MQREKNSGWDSGDKYVPVDAVEDRVLVQQKQGGWVTVVEATHSEDLHF